MLGSGVQQSLAVRVFTHGVDVRILADAAHDLRPRFAVVVGLPDVGREVVQQGPPHRDVRPAGVERRGVDLAHASEVRHVGRCNVGPCFPTVGGHVDQAVVGPGPDDVDVHLARSHREDGGVDLGTVHVSGDGSAGMSQGAGVGAGEVAAQGLPGFSGVGGPPEPIRRRVQRIGIEEREDDGERPLPPLHHVVGRLARIEPGIRAHLARRAQTAVVPVDVATVVRSREEDVQVLGIRRDVPRLPATCAVRHVHRTLGDGPRRTAAPTAPASAAAQPAGVPVRRQAQRAVVLLGPADMEGDVRRGDGVVKLGRGELLIGPVFARVEAHRSAPVVPDDHVGGVVRVDPEVVEVSVGAVVDDFGAVATVGRAKKRGVLDVDDVLVLVVCEDVAVVEGALPDRTVVVDQLPRRAGVIAAEESAVVVLEEGVHPVGVGARYRQADATHHPLLGHTRIPRDLGPRLAAVGALEHAAPRTAGGHRVLLAIRFPERRVHHVRVVAVDGDVDGPGPVIPVEDPLPRVATVGALEHPTLLAGSAVLPERRDEDDVGVGGVNADLGDAV